MTYKDLAYLNFIYVPVLCEDRMPPLMQFVPTIDEDGEIIIYRLTEIGENFMWNMRDGVGDNSPNNNKKIVMWLEKQQVIPDEQRDTFFWKFGLEFSDHQPITIP